MFCEKSRPVSLRHGDNVDGSVCLDLSDDHEQIWGKLGRSNGYMILFKYIFHIELGVEQVGVEGRVGCSLKEGKNEAC